MERTCDSLLMCIVTVLSHGLRSGGGVGDVLRKPSKEVRAKNDEVPKLCVLLGSMLQLQQSSCELAMRSPLCWFYSKSWEGLQRFLTAALPPPCVRITS